MPNGRLVPNVESGGSVAAARHFRKAFALPYDKWNSTRYLSTIGRQLNGKVQLLKGVGRHATWYVPAAIGLYNVAQAPSELKMRTLFEEGFGILGGALGTVVGSNVISVGLLGLLTVFGIGIGPLGIFIIVFFCSTAGGMIGMEALRRFGSGVYTYGELKINERIYYNPTEIILVQ